MINKNLFAKISLLLFLELFIIFVVMKVYNINELFISQSDSKLYFIFQIISHDSILFSFIFLFTYISYLKYVNRFISFLFRLFSLIICILYVIDFLILKNFSTHLNIDDISNFLSYAPTYILQEMVHIKYSYLYFLSFCFFLVISYFFLSVKFTIKRKSFHFIFVFFLLINIPMYLNAQSGRFVYSWVFKNFIEYNIEVFNQSQEYSKEFVNNLSYKEEKIYSDNNPKLKNIIILMVESLSSYQSKYFSAIKDWTPNIDKIAKENISFKNFYANGFMTEDAEISILTGNFPLYAPKIFSDGGGVSFSGFYNIKDSLPNIFKNKAYKTEFITSSDLEFSNTGLWAKSIGFDYIEGSSHPYYDDKKRYHFKAASDEYLYKRVLDRIDKQKSNYFMFIKTVSSHVPFINPQNDKKSEEETIKYVDEEIGKFYNYLRARNFFENGILLIVGDHHPLIPLKSQQVEKYGEFKASSIVPMIVVDGINKNKLINEQFQQTDIFNSLRNLVSKEKCNSLWAGDFLNSEIIKPKYIVFRRGDERGMITVFSENNLFNVKLKGDETSVINDVNQDNEILNKINYERIIIR